MMAMGISVPSSELERMGSELKCPICLSLYKQAASLSCNHCFCTSCIVQSMKRISCCPVCKVPATPREVRPAPQMDSLVTILKVMETSAGVSLFHSQQPSQLNSSEVVEGLAKQKQLGRQLLKSRGRQDKSKISSNVPLSEIVNICSPKKGRTGKSDEVVHPTNTRKRPSYGLENQMDKSAVYEQTMKKVRGTRLPLLPKSADEADQSKVKYVSSEPHGATSSRTANPKVAPRCEESIHPIVNQGYDKVLRVASENECGLSFPEKEGHDLVHHTCVPILDTSAQPPRLAPFFWLRDRVLPSQEEPPSQLTQTQGAGRPLRPSFSDLKGSDDDEDQSDDAQHPDLELAGNELPKVDSDDSDAVIWSQLSCSPELSSSPRVKQFHQWLHLEPKRLQKDDEPSPTISPHGVDGGNESRSPPKCLIGVPEEIKATQTPQLRQEPSRTLRTLSKCSEFQNQTFGGKVCRRLKPDAISSIDRQQVQQSRPKVRPNRPTGAKFRKHEANVSTDSPSEGEIRVEKNLENTYYDVAVDITGQHSRQQEGFNTRDVTPERPRNDSSGGDTGSMPDGEDRPPSCVFCGLAGDSEIAGPVVEYKDTFLSRGQTIIKTLRVHKLCAEWAPEVYFNESEPRNLACEVTRGQKIKCTSCGIRGAALGCCYKRCKRSFHYPCGRATPGCKWDEDDFVMFCPQHADCKFPSRKRCRVSPCRGPALSIAEKDRVDKDGTGGTSLGERLQKWPASLACKWVLCGSGLDSQMKGQLAAFASVTGMSACLSAGHIVSEAEYEVTSDTNGFRGGPHRSRVLAAARGPKLLEGLSFYFFGEFTSVSKEDLQSLIVAGRGVVLQRKPLAVEGLLTKRKRAVPVPHAGDTIVLYHTAESDARNRAAVSEEAKSLAANAGAVAVPHTWLMDSVASSELQRTSLRYSDGIK